jgi:hypothetical protein
MGWQQLSVLGWQRVVVVVIGWCCKLQVVKQEVCVFLTHVQWLQGLAQHARCQNSLPGKVMRDPLYGGVSMSDGGFEDC